MYTLTLTQGERRAIDWIGDRYAHGNDLYYRLWHDSTAVPDDADWDSPADITFTVPENVAWQIQEIVKADNLACFAPELVSKLQEFCDRIV